MSRIKSQRSETASTPGGDPETDFCREVLHETKTTSISPVASAFQKTFHNRPGHHSGNRCSGAFRNTRSGPEPLTGWLAPDFFPPKPRWAKRHPFPDARETGGAELLGDLVSSLPNGKAGPPVDSGQGGAKTSTSSESRRTSRTKRFETSFRRWDIGGPSCTTRGRGGRSLRRAGLSDHGGLNAQGQITGAHVGKMELSEMVDLIKTVL